jgi:hypothetical protein
MKPLNASVADSTLANMSGLDRPGIKKAMARPRPGPCPTGAERTLVHPVDDATQEIYRQKVARSFRLKPVPPTPPAEIRTPQNWGPQEHPHPPRRTPHRQDLLWQAPEHAVLTGGTVNFDGFRYEAGALDQGPFGSQLQPTITS